MNGYVVHIPDETLLNILEFRFKPPLSFLTVCKQWSRVGTPLLYEAVILRSSTQARALEKTLRIDKRREKDEKRGLMIKRLRLEGGFKLAIRTIVLASPNIKDLAFTLDIKSPDSASGLVAALKNIQVQRLAFIQFSEPDFPFEHLMNKASAQLRNTVEECMQLYWPKMHTLYFPYSEVWTSFMKAPSLQNLYLTRTCALALCRQQHLIGPTLKRVVVARRPRNAAELIGVFGSIESIKSAVLESPVLSAIFFIASR